MCNTRLGDKILLWLRNVDVKCKVISLFLPSQKTSLLEFILSVDSLKTMKREKNRRSLATLLIMPKHAFDIWQNKLINHAKNEAAKQDNDW